MAALCSAAPRAEASEDLRVGYLRPDGVVVPFAHFDGESWTALQCDSIRPAPSGDAIWFLPRPGGSTDTLRGGKWFDAVGDLEGDWGAAFRGQTTDFSPRDTTDEAAATVGIVMSQTSQATLFETVPERTDPWRCVVGAITPEFERQESLGVAASTARDAGSKILFWGHPISDTVRRAIPIRANVMAAEQSDGAMLFHVTASKEYPPPPRDETCPGKSTLNTWVQDGPSRLICMNSNLGIDNCDGNSTGVDTPLICFVWGDRTFVVVDERGYEWGTYSILEWTRSGPASVFRYMYHCL